MIVPGLTKACILGIDALKAFNSIINIRDDTFYVQDDNGVALKISYDNQEGEQGACHTVANIDISLDEIEAKVPGRFRSYEYEIHMKNDEPFAIISYPVPIKYREQVSCEIERMLEYGVIERAKTPFINPLVAVAKKDNTVRLCLDARQINDRMLEDHDGPEEIDQVLRQCNNIGVMSTLDLRSSFWQVPLAKSSRKYTGFLHQDRTYQFTVVLFGLKLASAALNRASEGVLNGMQGRVIDFVDDWLIVSPDFDQHVRDLDELLTSTTRV
uniref:Reverse transcriptase domain-containing protein n=1 Tax=Trichogramma kaykai TaxID=54128 RepID=A0ABD2X0P5_9HYME